MPVTGQNLLIMSDFIIVNARIVNEGKEYDGYIAVRGEFISHVGVGKPPVSLVESVSQIIDVKGRYVLPGCIDDQVHFREPGLIHKGEIATESKAALAGGVTSFMDMPNVIPPTVTLDRWEEKMKLGAAVSAVNYSFWIGATNDNIDVIKKADFSAIPGIKVFLGASTGNMLVNSEEALENIFKCRQIIAVHSEEESVIKENAEKYRQKYMPGPVPVECHPLIRSREACTMSTSKAINRARRHGTRLLILHISTAEEVNMLEAGDLASKIVNSEVCAHHLWFTDEDYSRLGTRIKWNPAVKTYHDRDELRRAVADRRIDIVATDHAPHLLSEKEGDALHAASGGPLVQHSLLMMMQLSREGHWDMPTVADMMAHRPALLFGVRQRGFIRPGYYADLVVVNPSEETIVTKESLLSKCGWSPLEGTVFANKIERVFVNGDVAYEQISDGHRFYSHKVFPLRFE